MIKVTTRQLLQIREAINTNGVLKADIYFSNEKGMPGQPTFEAVDVWGTHRVLVIWSEPVPAQPDSQTELLALVGKEALMHAWGKHWPDAVKDITEMTTADIIGLSLPKQL